MYERHIKPWIDKPVIKIITEMWRVGKSYLLIQLIGELRSNGVPECNLHFVDKESVAYDDIADYRDLANYLKSQRLSIRVDTVQDDLGYLTETYALNQVKRYDIRSKRNLVMFLMRSE